MNLTLRQTKFYTMRVHIPTSFIWIIIFFNGPFEYGDSGIFKLLRWMQNLDQTTWDHEILYADRSSMNKQLLVTPLFRKTRNTNMAGGWNLKYIFYVMERTREPLHLDKWSFVHWKIMDTPTSFICIIIFFDVAFLIWRWFDIFRLCWDKRWTTLRIIL
jgi:hypothetical protein